MRSQIHNARRFLSAGVAVFSLVATFALTPNAEATDVTTTVACSGGGNFTVDITTETVPSTTSTTRYSCVGTAIVPAGVTTIGQYSFYGSGITSVSLPEGLTTISTQAFMHTHLTSIDIPSSVTSIGYLALAPYTSLNSVNFESGGSAALTIGQNAFQLFNGGCMVLPARLSQLNFDAFAAPTDLKYLYFAGNAPTVTGGTPIYPGQVSNDTKLYYNATAAGFTDPWYGFSTASTNLIASTFSLPAFTFSSTSEVATRSTPITGYSVNSTGGAVGCYSVFPAVGNGLTFNSATGVISGTPTNYADPVTYTVTGQNGAGSASATYTISVPAPPAAPAFTLSTTSETATAGSPVAGYTINSTGGAVASYSISPSVSNGLHFDSTTGLISGTPTSAASPVTYTIRGTNLTNFATATYTITVNAPPVSAPVPDPVQQSAITGIEPTSALTGSPTPIVISGRFVERVTNISVAGVMLSPGSWQQSSTALSFILGSHAAGICEIQIYDGSVPVLAVQDFTFIASHPTPIASPTPVPTPAASVPTIAPTVSESVSPLPAQSMTSTPQPLQSEKASTSPSLSLKIYFDLGSASLNQENLQKLQSLAKQIIHLGQGLRVSITGYAQPTTGTEATDGPLSARRAENVAKILKQDGVTAKVVYLGAGRASLNVPSSRYVKIVTANS